METELPILIIDDNITNQSLFKQKLETEGYQVSIACNANEALNLIKNKKFDLIIQDLVLPDMDYLTLNTQIKEYLLPYETPIIALYGFLNKPDERHLTEKFSAHLIKPIESSHLIKIVKSFVPTYIHKEKNHYKILIIDDNQSQLKLLKLHLQYQGYTVNTAEKSIDALALIPYFTPHAIISDVLMPEMDGFELCLETRKLPQGKAIPFILLTSQYIEEADEILAKKVSADHYVTRSADFKKLMTILDDCLKNGRRVLDPPGKPFEFVKDEHTHRIIRQLERQILANSGLAERCALQFSHLTLLSEIANSLTKSTDIEKTLKTVLTNCLDAAGISKAALYLTDNDNNFHLKNIIGCPEDMQTAFMSLFSPTSLKESFSSKKEMIYLSLENTLYTDFLKKIDMISALISPLWSEEKCLGILLVGSKIINVNTIDSVNFIKNLSLQISKTLALAKAFERLYYSEQRYRILMDNSGCGIFILDYQGHILEVNKQGEKLLDIEKVNSAKYSLFDFIIEADKEKAKSSYQALIKEKILTHHEMHIKSQKNIEKTVEYTGVEIKTINESVLMIMTTDISERNKLRAQALMNDKLATVGILAAGVAHEINNPISWVMTNLGFIKSNINFLKTYTNHIVNVINERDKDKKLELFASYFNKHDGQIVFEFDEMISESIHGIERVKEIVKNLKVFSRIDAGDISYIDVHEVLNMAINMASLEFKYKATLQKQYARNLPLILGCSGKLQQVFLNLIINASQAIPEGESSHHLIKIKTEFNDHFIRIDISDSGSGIPENVLPYIFDPFFTTKKSEHGTGLGLSICHEIISQLKGKISVTSQIAEGSTFSVYLPVARSTLNHEEDIFALQRKRILIIDDEPFLLKSLMHILKPNYDVTTALGGEIALSLLKKHQGNFDVIICDLQMPGVNGADCYEYINIHYQGLEKKMIFVSGGSYTPRLKDFCAQSHNPLLEKPFKTEELLTTIQDILN